MHRDDLLSQVRIRARLHGRGHARRVVEAVVQSLQGLVPETALRDLTAQLPFEVGLTPSHRGGAGDSGAGASRTLIRDVARRLHVDEPDAAFYARITFEQLNAYCHGNTPARLAPSLPADVRPLLSARATEPAPGFRRRLATLGSAVGITEPSAGARAVGSVTSARSTSMESA